MQSQMTPKALGNSLYLVVQGSTWTMAESESASLGGNLASITSATEDKWIKDNIDWIPPKNLAFGAYGYDKSIAYWIGLTDNESEGFYKWSSGEAFSYYAPSWDKYPTNSEDYLTLVNNGDWNDISENEPHWQMQYGIAEIPITSTVSFSADPQEGSTLLTTINLSAGSSSSENLADGVTVYWKILGIDESDLSSGALQGSGIIADGKLSLSHSFAIDDTIENEFLVFSAYSDENFKNKIGETASVAIKDTSTKAPGGDGPTPTDKNKDLFNFLSNLVASKSTDKSLLQELEVSINWKDIDFNQVTTEQKKSFSWKYVDLGNGGSNSSLSTTDLFQIKAATGDLTSTYSSTLWKQVKVSEFSSETYAAINWSQVNVGKFQKFASSSVDWTKVQFGEFQKKQYKQLNWSQVNTADFTAETYQEIDWGMVSYSGKKSITKASGLDWTQVNFDQVFASPKAYKNITWSEVSFSSFSSADYSEIQWDKVAFKGKKSVSYSALDWSQVNFNQFEKKNYKKVNWKEAKTNQLTDSQYSAINWEYVALKGKKSADYSKLDWSKVINDDTFSAKAAKKVDWTQISASSLDSAALAKLKQDAFSGKNKKLSAWLDANTTSTTGSGSQSGISFAGIAQPQAAGGLTTGQESGGSAAEVLLAAVDKQPVLI